MTFHDTTPTNHIFTSLSDYQCSFIAQHNCGYNITVATHVNPPIFDAAIVAVWRVKR